MAHNTTVNFFCDLDFDAEAALNRLGLNPGGRVQSAIDEAVLRFSQDFVPFDSGSLEKSPWRATAPHKHLWDKAKEINVPGSGEVIYPGPYATYLYYGEVYGPNIPIFDVLASDNPNRKPVGFFSPPNKSKHPTGRQMEYKKDKHKLAGPFWIDHMKQAHMKDIIAEAEGAMKGGGK